AEAPAAGTVADAQAPAAATDVPPAAPAAGTPAAPAAGETQLAMVDPAAPAEAAPQAPAPSGAEQPAVRVEAVEIEGRTVFVAGMASPGLTVRVYANAILLGEAPASEGGRFLIETERDLPVGDYIVRADLLADGGRKVVARAAVPFQREAGESIAAIAAPPPAIVQAPAPDAPTADAAATAPADAPQAADAAAQPAEPAAPQVAASEPAQPTAEKPAAEMAAATPQPSEPAPAAP
ncbi:peptigoglycan-binding protein LysM, partial [Aquibium sp. ELW1220]|nr:peptigoglycan-binding protein LysM [Aquibium sp. ELW1220]